MRVEKARLSSNGPLDNGLSDRSLPISALPGEGVKCLWTMDIEADGSWIAVGGVIASSSSSSIGRTDNFGTRSNIVKARSNLLFDSFAFPFVSHTSPDRRPSTTVTVVEVLRLCLLLNRLPTETAVPSDFLYSWEKCVGKVLPELPPTKVEGVPGLMSKRPIGMGKGDRSKMLKARMGEDVARDTASMICAMLDADCCETALVNKKGKARPW